MSTSSRRSQRSQPTPPTPERIRETTEEPLPETVNSPGDPTTNDSTLRRLREAEFELELRKKIMAEMAANIPDRPNNPGSRDIKISTSVVSIRLSPRSSLEQRQRWFSELDRIFIAAPYKYSVDANRITTAFFCIEPNHRAQWSNYELENFPGGPEEATWEDFKDWTLLFIRGGRSSKIDIAVLYHSARQLPQQDPNDFHAYLGSIEKHMSLTEEQKAMGYFAKLVEPLRRALNISYQANLPEDRQEMLQAAIRTWDNKNLGPHTRKRNRDDDTSPIEPKRQKTAGKSHGASSSLRDEQPGWDRKNPSEQRQGSSKRPDHSKLTCYTCGKLGHISTNCRDKKEKETATNANINEITMEYEHSENDSESE
jgi:hypothetical protein